MRSPTSRSSDDGDDDDKDAPPHRRESEDQHGLLLPAEHFEGVSASGQAAVPLFPGALHYNFWCWLFSSWMKPFCCFILPRNKALLPAAASLMSVCRGNGGKQERKRGCGGGKGWVGCNQHLALSRPFVPFFSRYTASFFLRRPSRAVDASQLQVVLPSGHAPPPPRDVLGRVRRAPRHERHRAAAHAGADGARRRRGGRLRRPHRVHPRAQEGGQAQVRFLSIFRLKKTRNSAAFYSEKQIANDPILLQSGSSSLSLSSSRRDIQPKSCSRKGESCYDLFHTAHRTVQLFCASLLRTTLEFSKALWFQTKRAQLSVQRCPPLHGMNDAYSKHSPFIQFPLLWVGGGGRRRVWIWTSSSSKHTPHSQRNLGHSHFTSSSSRNNIVPGDPTTTDARERND